MSAAAALTMLALASGTPDVDPAPAPAPTEPAPTATAAAEPAPPAKQPSPVVARDDGPHPKARIGTGAAMLALGVGAGISAGALGHAAFHPRCLVRNDVTTCELPDGQDLRRRAGLLVGAGSLTIAGGVLGGLGARVLMRGLASRDTSLAERTRLRTAATVVGATTLTLGLASIITGPILIGVGTRRIASLEGPEIDPDDVEASERAVMRDLAGRVNGIRIVRSGIALLLVSPTLIATGAGFLRNRPPRNDTVRVTPTLNPTFAGVTVSGTF